MKLNDKLRHEIKAKALPVLLLEQPERKAICIEMDLNACLWSAKSVRQLLEVSPRFARFV